MSKISRFTKNAVTLANNAVGGQSKVAAPKRVAASPTTPSFRFTVFGVLGEILPRGVGPAERDATYSRGNRPRRGRPPESLDVS